MTRRISKCNHEVFFHLDNFEACINSLISVQLVLCPWGSWKFEKKLSNMKVWKLQRSALVNAWGQGVVLARGRCWRILNDAVTLQSHWGFLWWLSYHCTRRQSPGHLASKAKHKVRGFGDLLDETQQSVHQFSHVARIMRPWKISHLMSSVFPLNRLIKYWSGFALFLFTSMKTYITDVSMKCITAVNTYITTYVFKKCFTTMNTYISDVFLEGLYRLYLACSC